MRRIHTPGFRAQTIASRSLRGSIMIALSLLIVVAARAPNARAQTCPLTPRTPYAGHQLPLDSSPDIQPMSLVRVFTNLSFSSPLGLTAPRDETNRIFVWERIGRILVFENRPDVQNAEVFLDISSPVQSGGEQGLLGLAFDPDYEQNGRFYVNYTSVDCVVGPWCTKIVRYEVSAADPNEADAGSAFELLQFPQFATNHNGGAIEFGPDGLLYIATGDGGGSGDPEDNGQDLATRLGALLRIDVRDGAPSLIPADNPFVGTPGADPAIFHYGLRNPWRVTFDRVTGDLYIADVGQGSREEVDFAPAGTPGGLNFGWNYCEGTLDFRSGASCSDIISEPPVIEYGRSEGNVIIGGYVYRDDELPELQGAYIYHDAGSTRIWAWDRVPAQDPTAPGNPGVQIASGVALNSFGEDRNGGFYGLGAGPGHVYKLQRSGGGGSGDAAFPSLLSETGLFSDVASLTVMPGVLAYDVAAPLWSDGAAKFRWIALPGQSRITFHADQAWSFPIGTAFIKHFELPLVGGGSRRLETRVFLRQQERWVGVTYRWNVSGTDANLLTDGLDEDIDLGGGEIQPWHYPSASECLSCHTAAAGRVLGFRTRQLGASFDYVGGTEIQLEALDCGGYFDIDIRDPDRYAKAVAIGDGSASRTAQVRSYHATNCEMCHQPSGTAPGGLDLRFTSAVSQWNALGVDPTSGDLGLTDPKRIEVGDADQSILWVRQQSADPNVKMARGTLTTDLTAAAVTRDWIDFDTSSVDSDEDTESDATDNCASIANPDQGDADMDGIGDACDPDMLPALVPESMNAPAGMLSVGDAVELSSTIENVGGGDAGDFPVTFYLSQDSKFDAGLDSPAGSCWIESLSTGSTFACSTIGASVPSDAIDPGDLPQTRFWLACANASRVQREAGDKVECLASTEPVLIPEPSAWVTGLSALTTVLFVRSVRSRFERRV